MSALMSLVLLWAFNPAALCQEIAVQTYTGFYTGKIIPTPQEVTYEADTWELADVVAQTASACILISSNATEAEKLAARAATAASSPPPAGTTWATGPRPSTWG